ncbi:hypothetical protein LT85_4091 [Collimonas arenae]|uniref:Uncharacterized protein n=1 Tax=Collimonas arenae TaxID=279058 RepID=A0A0A1FI13_9BURK|nr:hypothetical protein [Collimonas arenae]AIY43249.1 hypothetical protein LT85_4091 [Collimonas arenae]
MPPNLQCSATAAGTFEGNINAIAHELDTRLISAFGENWAAKEASKNKKQIDQKTMSEIAKIASCAAVPDKELGCSIFFDPEFSSTLGAFTMLPGSAPLRQQFDAALNTLPEGKETAAAEYCMKSVARK